jgi:hypothetical protein
LNGKDGRLEFMGQVLQEFFSIGLVLFQQFDLFVPFLAPFFNILANLVDAFLGQDVFEVDLFFFGGLGLMDQLVNEFDLTIDEFFQGELDQAVAAGKDDQQGDRPGQGIGRQQLDAYGDRHGQQSGGERRKLLRG